MFGRLGRLVAAHPWRVIAVWIVAFAVIVPFSPSLADVTNEDQTSFLPSSDESSRAQALAEKHFPTASGATARFVLKREDGQGVERRRPGVRSASSRAGSRRPGSRPSTRSRPAPSSSPRTNGLSSCRSRSRARRPTTRSRTRSRSCATRRREPARRQRPAGRAHRRRRERRGYGGVVRQRRDDHLRRHLRADPAPGRRHLPQPHRGDLAARDDRARVPARDLAGRTGRRHVRLRGRLLAHLAADRRAVRDRHRLHPLPALPLPRAAAGRRRVASGGRLLRSPCRPGRRELRAGRDHRVPRSCCWPGSASSGRWRPAWSSRWSSPCSRA